MADNSSSVSYDDLFDMWADFDDAEAAGEASNLIEERGLGPVDAVSFLAFCHGYEKAIQKTRRAL